MLMETKDEIPTTPKPRPAPSLSTVRQSQAPVLPPVPVKAEPEKPLSLWDRKKLKVASRSAAASSLSDGMNSTVRGDAAGGEQDPESVIAPTTVGGRQSIFTDTARDQKRRNEREDVGEGLLGSIWVRKRNAPPPAAPLKSSGWEVWGSLAATTADQAAVPERPPSPGHSPGRSLGWFDT